MERVIWYEPHPVSRGRKADLLARGYRIIDARYAPDGWRPPSENGSHQDMPSAARASARAESGTGANPGETGTDFKKLTADGLKAALTERGIAFDAKAKKADLLALLAAAEQGDE